MCQLTEKLILCSCEKKEDLCGNHWVLKRFGEGEDIIVIGETLISYFDPQIRAGNIRFLTKELNEGNCFDFDPEFQENDQLVLSFKHKDTPLSESLYAFEFLDGKFTSVDREEPDYLTQGWYQTIRKGSILKA